jgi:anti-sigma regulatory factor (Ser/Thr protein kinase)
MERTIVWEASGEATRVLRARREFRDRLVQMTTSQAEVEACELIFGELVANTVRYAPGNIEVRLELAAGERILVVRDYGPGLRVAPWPPRRDPMAESGRGLAIVELLARSLAVENCADGGTRVSATLPVAA